jgi:hypothetical protein
MTYWIEIKKDGVFVSGGEFYAERIYNAVDMNQSGTDADYYYPPRTLSTIYIVPSNGGGVYTFAFRVNNASSRNNGSTITVFASKR